MKKTLKSILVLASLLFLLVLPYFVFAADPLKKLENVGKAGGYSAETNQYTFAGMMGTVVQAFLSLLGVIFVCLLVYAGFKYMLARGSEEEVKKSLELIKQAIIGLIIVVSAFSIWVFIGMNLLGLE